MTNGNEKETGWLGYLMTYGWALLIVTVIFIALLYLGIIQPMSVSSGNACNATSKFIEFYGAECSHCANMVPVVAQVENETGVKFDRLEVWHNTTNQQVFDNYNASIMRDCGGLGVPTFYSLQTNKSACGEMPEANLKQFVTSNC